MHFLPQLSDFVLLRNGFYSFRAQTAQHHPADADSYAVVTKPPTHVLNEAEYARSEYHTQLAKMSFDKKIRSHSWSVFNILYI